MQHTDPLVERLHSAGVVPTLVEFLPHYMEAAPSWLDPASLVWNIAPLHRRSNTRTLKLDFTRISHNELRDIARVRVLGQIVDHNVGPQSLKSELDAFVAIGTALRARPISTLKTEDFYSTERSLRQRYGPGTAARRCADLQRIAKWLSRHTGMRLDYISRHRAPSRFGREGTDEQRDTKLLPDVVVADLLAANRRENISARDRFFLSALAISTATGFRISELVTLPLDCLIRDQGALLMRCFAAKGGREAPRPIPSELAEIVTDAVDYIKQVTEHARAQARAWIASPPIDWEAVIHAEDHRPFEYFVRQWLAGWIADPKNRMVDNRFAFYSRGKKSRWVPIADLLDTYNGNVSAISREIGLSRSSVDRLIEQLKSSQNGKPYLGNKTLESRRAFDTDIRIPSIAALEKHIGINLLSSPKSQLLTELINEARAKQLALEPFHAPSLNDGVEQSFRFKPEVLRDSQSGDAILEMQDALFVLYKNQLSDSHAIDYGRVVPVTTSQFNHWASGYTRDRGTGKHGDAVCARLGITDPRTGQPARFTNHDFRHWLATAYENGGLSQIQIATLFNRKSTASNSVYDQTNSKIRHTRLKNAMADGLLIGHAAQAYDQIAAESKEEAAEYLESATKFYNPMPHGVCRLNWALEPCPHALSCFSCGDDKNSEVTPCEHLIIETGNEAQLDEIERIHRNAVSIQRVMEEDGGEASPQYARFNRIAQSTASILKTTGRK